MNPLSRMSIDSYGTIARRHPQDRKTLPDEMAGYPQNFAGGCVPDNARLKRIPELLG
jgi:hypothetical protein